MGGGKSHSRSRSRNGKKKHKKHKDHKNKSRSSSKSHDKGGMYKERKSRFSDKPPSEAMQNDSHNGGGGNNRGSSGFSQGNLNPLQQQNQDRMSTLASSLSQLSAMLPQQFQLPNLDRQSQPPSQMDQLNSLNILNNLKQPPSMPLQDLEKQLSQMSDSYLNQTFGIDDGQKMKLNENFLIQSSGGENPQQIATDILKKLTSAQNSNTTIIPNFSNLPGLNPNIANTLNDSSKIKRKVYVPKDTSFNYTGLIIGPKGHNQKRLEEITQCKILVRGKGSQKEGQPPQPDDDEDMHVLIVGDNESSVAKACAEVERIIFADEDTRNKLRQEQLKMVAQIKNDTQNAKQVTQDGGKVDPSLTTPYGPPSQDAYIIPVPKDCVGLVIGKGGETIRMLQERSGARRVQVALDNSEGSDMRNVFVEGNHEQVEMVKKMLNDIVENQRKMKTLQNCQNRVEYGIPTSMVGLVIGKNGETVKSINQRTGAFVALSREEHHNSDPKQKILLITGTQDAIEAAKKEIDTLVENGVRHQQHKQLQTMAVNNPQLQQMLMKQQLGMGQSPPQMMQSSQPGMDQSQMGQMYMQGNGQPPNMMMGDPLAQQQFLENGQQQQDMSQQPPPQMMQPQQMMMIPPQMGYPMQPFNPYANSMMQYQYMASEGPQIEETCVPQHEEGNEKKRRRNRR